MPHPTLPYNRAMRWLPLMLALVCTPARAAEPVEVDKAQTDALVAAVRGQALSRSEHDLLVDLGTQSDDATPLDRLWVGWALVFAERPDLGLPRVRKALAEAELGASDALRTLLFAETAGQDGLVRATLELLRRQSPEGARRLRNSIRSPEPFERAQKKARGALKGLESGVIDTPFDGGEHARRTWFVRPTSPTLDAVIWLPDGGTAEGLPAVCQDASRLREAAVLARAGHPVYLPGLRGCDTSDGTYRGAEDAGRDVAALVPRIQEREGDRPVALFGLEEGGLLGLRIADAAGVDRVAAWQPTDPGEADHLPPDVIAAHDPTLPKAPTVVVLPYPALAELLGRSSAELVPLKARDRGETALEVLAASAASPQAR